MPDCASTPDRRTRWLSGLAAAALGAEVFALAAALLDARYAAVEKGALDLFAGLAGLIAPIGLLVGLCVGLARVFMADGAGLSPVRFVARLRALEGPRRGSAAVALVGAALACLVFAVTVANSAVRLLATGAPAIESGAALALSSAAIGSILLVLVQAGALALGPRFQTVSPERAALLAAALLVVGLGGAIAAGTTSGTGGLVAVFGVFKRPELDLRGPGLVLLIAAGAAVLPAPKRARGALLAGCLALAPFALTLYSASGAFSSRHVALAVERGAPLGKRVLAVARSLSDRDGDGASAYFGGGDCDDSDPAVGPDAIDVPGNGRDEDCSGSDEPAIAPPAPAAGAAPAAPAATLPKDLNVVLITIDTLRWDLGYMGYGRPVSPNLDALAARSVVFENAYALASYTAKSLGPMLIGKYAGETDRGWAHFNRFPKSEPFLQERLQEAGVFTLSVQGYWYFYKDAGFERGFDVIDASAAPKLQKVEGDDTFNSDKISSAVLAQLEKPELATRRFFLWAHYVDPHSEYVHHAEFGFGKSPRDRYDSEVAFVDREVGRVLEALKKSPFAERTAVIVTSDHGEAFGEHGMIRHGFELWEELVRVPLIVHVPGVEPRRIAVRRSTIDLVPTVLELFGAPRPSGEGKDFVSGRSLVPDLFAAPENLEARPVYVDMAAGPYNAERQAYIEGDLKLVLSGARPLALFDLKSDPGEKKDLLDRAEIAEPILKRYKAFRSSLRSVRVVPSK